MMEQDKYFYKIALKEAKKGLQEGGIPIGAVLVHEGKVIATGRNQRLQMGSSTRHGETDCIERAGILSRDIYSGSTLYTTLSPCSMCSGTILLYKIPRVVIGENVNFKGEEEWLIQRGIKIDVLNDEETVVMMRQFIQQNPHLWANDIGEA